ncbi:hypothetical protein [Gorillibacterium sp. sgz5001074]|uniref:hypothetical protein n=1 Tax=Gorillibacterium sp. sgz5001074 TaxID=3446695 RepID=UPI003F666A09
MDFFWDPVGVVPLLFIVFYLSMLGIGIYCIVLFIRLAHRGIKALDLYIADKSNRLK